jgi:competence protein ComEC
MLGRAIDAQASRWALWLPLGLMAGAAWYLALPVEPHLVVSAAVAGLAGACSFWLFMSPRAARFGIRAVLGGAALLLCAVAAGACVARLHALAHRPTHDFSSLADQDVSVRGWVVARDSSNGRLRLTIEVIRLETEAGVVEDAVGSQVRFSMRMQAAGLVGPGRAVACRGRLSRPSGPVAPGAYDFARRAYFEGLAATGFALGPCRPVMETPSLRSFQRVWLQLAAARTDLSDWIVARNTTEGGAIAAALITGDRTAITPETALVLQNAGLAHVLSVSGLHMAIVGGLVFWALRWTFCFWSWLALRVSVRKIAALGALIALSAYCVLSGVSVPAQRAFLMGCVAFGAILVDRPAISMRGLALALGLIVLWSPQAVLEPGFQMSFAATAALVAVYEMLAERDALTPKVAAPGLLIHSMQSVWAGLAGSLTTSFVAGMASEIFALQHFQRIALYGLPANLAAAPLISFVVAPAAGIAAVLAPFGLAEVPLQVMAWGLDVMTGFARAFADRPEGIQPMAAMPGLAFVSCVTGLIWACAWRGLVRLLGAVGVGLGLWIATATGPVVAIQAGDRPVWLIRGAGSERGEVEWTWVGPSAPDRFTRERMAALAGIAPARSAQIPFSGPCELKTCLDAVLPPVRRLLTADPLGTGMVGMGVVVRRTPLGQLIAERQASCGRTRPWLVACTASGGPD